METAREGLSQEEAVKRQEVTQGGWRNYEGLRLFVSQLAPPLVQIRIVAALLSLVLREWLDATIILVIVAGTGILGFTQEYSASKAIAELRSRLVAKSVFCGAVSRRV